MRISDIGNSNKAGSTKKTRRVDGDGSFSKFLDDGSGEDSKSVASAPAIQLGGILAIDNINPGQLPIIQERLKHGHALLDELDKLRIELLSGQITPQSAKQLVEKVRDEQTKSPEPELEALLNDIELRAEVEIAKLEKL